MKRQFLITARIAYYRSRNFNAACAYTSGSCSPGFCPSSLLRVAGGLLNGVAIGKAIRVISVLGPDAPSSWAAYEPTCRDGCTTVKRPSSDGSMSRMRSPRGVWRTARVKGPAELDPDAKGPRSSCLPAADALARIAFAR